MTIDEARTIVFRAKPIFAETYHKYKDKKWKDYIEENYPKQFSKNDHSEELFETIQKLLLPLIGKTKTESAIKTLEKKGFVSTCDHSGILCHPFFSNIALARSENIDPNDSVISFTCGAVSLTNSSFPRSIFFHDKNLELQKLHLVSLQGRRRSVYGLPSFSKKRIEQIVEKIKYLNLEENQKEKLQNFFSNILKNEKIFGLERYNDQLTIMNNLFWQELFEDKRGDLIYIEAEQIIRQILLDIHLEKETPIHKILFDENFRRQYLEQYEGIVGSHNTKEKTGSHLFWYIDETLHTRVQLFSEQDSLVSIDKKIKIPLQPEIIKEYLLRYELLPTMAFCYSILSFYYGLTLGGGFSQIKYLEEMKKAWENIFPETSSKIRTDIFAGEFTLLGIANNNKTNPATLFDLFLYSKNPQIDVQNTLSEVSIGESIDAMMDELVEIVSGKKPIIENLNIHKTLYVKS